MQMKRVFLRTLLVGWVAYVQAGSRSGGSHAIRTAGPEELRSVNHGARGTHASRAEDFRTSASQIRTGVTGIAAVASQTKDVVSLGGEGGHQYTMRRLDRRSDGTIAPFHVLLTGANSGIGFEAAKMLAHMGATVHMACRNATKCKSAADAIKLSNPVGHAKVVPYTLELRSAHELHPFIEAVKREVKYLDLFVSNAAVNFYTRGDHLTKDGFETTLQVNYLSPSYIIHEMLPLLRNHEGHPGKGGRIVMTASEGHGECPPYKATDINPRNDPVDGSQYSLSKFLIIQLAQGLHRRERANGVVALSFHPGLVDTKLIGDVMHAGAVSSFLYRTTACGIFWWRGRSNGEPCPMTAKQGADTLIWASTEPSLGTCNDQSTRYFLPARNRPVPLLFSGEPWNAEDQDFIWQKTIKWMEKAVSANNAGVLQANAAVTTAVAVKDAGTPHRNSTVQDSINSSEAQQLPRKVFDHRHEVVVVDADGTVHKVDDVGALPREEFRASLQDDTSANRYYVQASMVMQNDDPSSVEDVCETLKETEMRAPRHVLLGALAGLLAGLFQVFLFMWLRTVMNHQYNNGGTLWITLKQLWEEGGIVRLYAGIHWAALEVPLARFGDTFANEGVISFFLGSNLHPMFQTVFVAIAAAMWRIIITPIDMMKTTSQVHGAKASSMLWDKVQQGGILVFWSGAVGNLAANIAGTYPWWATFNTLSFYWIEPESPSLQIIRHGIIGILSSLTSDCVSNAFRVVKTMYQCRPDVQDGYLDVAWKVVQTEGFSGLMCRGLGTRLLTNVLQGTFFAIVWKLIEKELQGT